MVYTDGTVWFESEVAFFAWRGGGQEKAEGGAKAGVRGRGGEGTRTKEPQQNK